jgi:hypothetical protein
MSPHEEDFAIACDLLDDPDFDMGEFLALEFYVLEVLSG